MSPRARRRLFPAPPFQSTGLPIPAHAGGHRPTGVRPMAVGPAASEAPARPRPHGPEQEAAAGFPPPFPPSGPRRRRRSGSVPLRSEQLLDPGRRPGRTARCGRPRPARGRRRTRHGSCRPPRAGQTRARLVAVSRNAPLASVSNWSQRVRPQSRFGVPCINAPRTWCCVCSMESTRPVNRAICHEFKRPARAPITAATAVRSSTMPRV